MATRVPEVGNRHDDYTTVDDRLLVLDFQSGHPEAFVEIHRRYGALARHVCRRFLPNAMDADEAVQETMIRVFQGLFRFNGQYALQPWIARIATNVALDQIRTKARRPQLDDGAIEEHEREDSTDGPELLVERLFERDLVLSVLADLPETHRTALVLREMEGRSHREIAERMGITAPQAKALIHRAKGSFRRAWLVKVTERGGFAGFALAPLVWLLRVTGSMKRFGAQVADAGRVVHVAAPELVTSTTSMAAPATLSFGERAVAAGMTLLLAGGVTVGAATTIAHRSTEDTKTRVVAAPATSDPSSTPSPSVHVTSTPKEETVSEKPDRGDHHGVLVVESPSPSTPSPDPYDPTDPTTSPEPPAASGATGPVADPSMEPSPEPSPQPTPVFGPAPAWTFEMSSSTTSIERCSCDDAPTLVASDVASAEPGSTSFMQVVSGAVRDADNTPTWGFYLNEWGDIQRDGGTLEFEFSLDSIAGEFRYSGTADLTATDRVDDGASTTYTFMGSFASARDQLPPAGLPIHGEVVATVSVWADGTLYHGSMELRDLAQ